MEGKIQTVLGPIDPDQIGFTLTHEHLLHDLPISVFDTPFPQHLQHLKDRSSITIENLGWIRQYPYCFVENISFNDASVRNAVKEELKFLKKYRPQVTVVDNSSFGLRAKGHAEYLKDLSANTGVNIVMGTGFYVKCAQTNSTLNMTKEQMENKMWDEIETGVESTGVKCGVIGEIGCSWPILPFEKKSLEASAMVQHATSITHPRTVPVIIHPGRNKNAPEEIIRIFQEAGGKVNKTVMSHLDRTLLLKEELSEFASLGTFLEFDLFGTEVSHYQHNEDVDMPSDAQRLERLRFLRDEGYGEKIVVSHDVHTKHRLEKFGGHGYSHLFVNIIPKMLKRGFTEEDIKKIFFLNPKKWLTFE